MSPDAPWPRPSDEGSGPPTALTRSVGIVVAVAAAALALAWFVVPVSGPGGGASTTLAQATQGSFDDVGVALHCALALALGLAGALRPDVGPGVVAMAALPLPWLLRFNIFALDAERPAVLVLLTVSATLLAGAVGVALVAGVRRVALARTRPTSAQAAAWAVGALGVAGAAGLGWYRLRPAAATGLSDVPGYPDAVGGVLGVATWSARGSSVGLVLAALAVGLAALSPDPTRRIGGWALVVVSATESVRRAVLPVEELSPFPVPDLVTVEILPLGLLVPLLGAAAGAWMALGPDPDAAVDHEGDGVGAEPVGPVTVPAPSPPTGPPTAWPEPPRP